MLFLFRTEGEDDTGCLDVAVLCSGSEICSFGAVLGVRGYWRERLVEEVRDQALK